jgi:hypothetical protein
VGPIRSFKNSGRVDYLAFPEQLPGVAEHLVFPEEQDLPEQLPLVEHLAFEAEQPDLPEQLPGVAAPLTSAIAALPTINKNRNPINPLSKFFFIFYSSFGLWVSNEEKGHFLPSFY